MKKIIIIVIVLLLIFLGFNYLRKTSPSSTGNLDQTTSTNNQQKTTDPSSLTYGDKIMFNYGGSTVTKRIVGLPGDTVLVSFGTLYINGKNSDRYVPEILVDENDTRAEHQSIVLKSDEYYVLDLFNGKGPDSRTYGPVKKTSIIAKVLE